MFGKILKLILCGFFGIIALFFIIGAVTQGKEFWCFPVGFLVAGFLTSATAKRKSLEGSALKWGLYGALVPVASWVEVVMTQSKSKVKGFLKGITYSFCGIFVFLAVFSSFLPPAPPKKTVAEEIRAEDRLVIPATASPVSKSVVAVLPAQASNKAVSIVAPSKPEPKHEQGVKREPARETFPVYYGRKQVLIDTDEETQVSKPVRASTSGSGNVVITPKGKKYHYASCRTVRGSYTRLTVAQARKRGYKPCKVCSPPSR